MANKEVVLNLPGISTEHCIEDVLRAVHSVPGISKANVSLEDKSVTIEYDDTAASAADFIAAIDAQGFQAEQV